MIYKLRVILETESDVFRDIEVDSEQTLIHLHQGIKNAFDLEGEELASFYLSNDEWFQGSEIPLIDTSEDESGETMDQIKIEDVLSNIGSRAIYVYDFLSMWTFYCEVVETDVISANGEYPAVVFAYGKRPDEAPEQDMFADIDIDFEDEDEEDDDSYLDPDNYY
ncbi:MAG: IS1096 element passenger TnpR family protein [Weeksellaceae bacterium]